MSLPPSLSHLSPPSLQALPTASAQTGPSAEPTVPVVSATQPHSPCDIYCVSTWQTVFSASFPETDYRAEAHFIFL